MTDNNKEDLSSTRSLQVHEMLQKTAQLPTPTPSRESSRVGLRQTSAHVEQPQQPPLADKPQQVDETLPPYRRAQTPQAQPVEQQPPEVKRKRGRPRKRPLSPSSEYPHVKVRVVPTTAQAEYLRQQAQGQSQTSRTPRNIALPTWQNAQALSDPNVPNIFGTIPAPSRTDSNGMVSGAQTASHPPDAQYPPDVSSIWPADQSLDRYPPVVDPFPEWSGLTAQQLVPLAQPDSRQLQDDALTMSQMFNDVTNYQQSQTPNTAIAVSKDQPKHAAASEEVGRKRRPRPSLKVRENSAQVGEEGTTAPRQNQTTTEDINNRAALTNSIPKAKTGITKAPKATDKRRGQAGANDDNTTTQKHHGLLPAENSSITDTSLLRHDNMVFQPRLRSDSLKSNSQVLSQPSRPAQTQALHQPPNTEPLPWHVTRWHELGFMTFETGDIDSDTGEMDYRVVLRTGKLDNALAFWYEHAVGGIALKYGPKKGKETGEVVFTSVSEVANMMVKAREDMDVPRNAAKTAHQKSMQQKKWDFLLEDTKYEAEAWKAQRRSKWDGLKIVQKEVRARRLSRGDFVADEDEGEDCGTRSDVAMADGDEGENAVGGEAGLGYHWQRPQIGSHWMSREEVQKVVRPGEVLRSRLANVPIREGTKTKYKMVYCPMQSPIRSDFEKGLGDLEQRLEGLRICRKSKLRKVFEQIEAGAYCLKRAAEYRVESE